MFQVAGLGPHWLLSSTEPLRVRLSWVVIHLCPSLGRVWSQGFKCSHLCSLSLVPLLQPSSPGPEAQLAQALLGELDHAVLLAQPYRAWALDRLQSGAPFPSLTAPSRRTSSGLPGGQGLGVLAGPLPCPTWQLQAAFPSKESWWSGGQAGPHSTIVSGPQVLSTKA